MADDYPSQLTSGSSGLNGILAANSLDKKDDNSDRSLWDKINTNEKEDKEFFGKQLKKTEEIAVPQKPPMPTAPKAEDFHTPAIDTFGSAAMMVATLGSLLTRQPVSEALNAAAGVMNTVHANDAKGFKAAYDKWKDKTNYAWKMAEWDQNAYKDALAKGDAEGRLYALTHKNDTALMAIQMKMGQQNHADMVRALKQGRDGSDLIIKYSDAAYDKAIAKGKTPEEASVAQMKAFGEAKNMIGGKDNGVNGNKIDFSSLKPDDIVPGTGLTLSALDQKVEILHSGGSYADAGISTRASKNPQKDALDDRLAIKYPDFNRVESEIGLAGDKAESRKEGIISGSLKTASNLLDQSIPLLREASKNIDQKNWTDLNSFENYFKTHSNDPNLIKFRVALQTTMNDYTALGVRNGQTSDHARTSTEKLVNDLMSKRGIDAFADQIEKEKESVLKGVNVTRGKGGANSSPTEADIAHLKKFPSSKESFDNHFGEGSAEKILKGSSNE